MNIYSATTYFFNTKYFDFLEIEPEAPDIRTIGKTYRDYLEFYALYNEKIPIREKATPKHNPDDEELEFFNIRQNFYLGHLSLESLLHHKKGEEILFAIAEKRNKELNRYREEALEEIEQLSEISKQHYKTKLKKLLEQKYIYSFNEFLEGYENTKDNDFKKFQTLFGGLSPTKSDYIKFLSAYVPAFQVILKKKLEAFIPNKARYKHTHITGQSGSGKSELMKGLIYSVLRTQKKYTIKSIDDIDENRVKKIVDKIENFILLDPHGDLADDVFNMSAKFHLESQPKRTSAELLANAILKGLGYKPNTGKTILLDPFLENGKTPVLNPFDFKGTETERNSYTEELLNVFREILGTDFTMNAEAILIPCISTLLKIENSSLYDLQRFMNDEQNEDLVERGKITKNFAHKNFFETGFYSSNLNSTKRAIFLKLQILLNNKTFSDLTTGKSTLDIEEIMNEGQNLVIKLNKKKMRETLSPFGRFVIAKIQSIALKRAETPEALRPKTHLFIDEFQNFISPTTEEILTESRKYRLYLTLAHQVISQLEESKLKDIILSNTNIKIVGQNGQKTLNALAKEIGIKSEVLEELKTGEFFVKVGKNPAFKMYFERLDYFILKETKEVREYKKQILDYYYTTPTIYKIKKPETDTKKHFVNNVILDKKPPKTTKEEEKTTQNHPEPEKKPVRKPEETPEENHPKPKFKPKFDDF